MKQSTIAAIVCSFAFFLFSGCETHKHKNSEKNWRTIESKADFKRKVERSPKLCIWGYMGSDDTYHYFVRQPGGFMTLNPYRYYKVPKDEYMGISSSEEETYREKGNAIFSTAFSERNDGKGWNHSLERGLIESTWERPKEWSEPVGTGQPM